MSTMFLLDVAIKATLYLALLFAIAGLLRRTTAAARHLLWSVGLIGLVAIPALSVVLPWKIGILPARVIQEAPAMEEGAPSYDPSQFQPTYELPEVEGSEDEASTAEKPRAYRAAPPPVSGTGGGPSAGGGGPDLPTAIALLWLAGTVAVLGRLVIGWLAIWRITRGAEVLDGSHWQRLYNHAAMRMGVVTPVRLLKSRRAPVPFGAGLIRPVVVFPGTVDLWDDDRRLAVMLHEIAHLQRGDAIPHLISQVVCAVFWFHPLVWLAARRLRIESERACDDLVLRSGTRPSQYVEHLIEIVRGAGRSWALTAAQPMARRSDFEGRVLAILEPGVKRHGLTPTGTLSVVLAVALTAVPVAAMGPGRPEAGADRHAADGSSGEPALQTAVDEASVGEAEPRLEEVATETTGLPAGERAARPTDAEPTVSDPEPVAAEPEPVSAAETESRARSKPAKREAVEGRQDGDRSRRVTALVAALADEDVEVRHQVVRALGNLQDTSAVTALMRSLREDGDAEVRKAAAWALGEIEDPRAIPALAEALAGDEVMEVRATAIWALGEIEDPRAVPALSQALGSADVVEIRVMAARALAEIEDPQAIPALGAALSDPDREVRLTAIHALGEIETAAAADALTPALADADVEIRGSAVMALGEIEDSRSVPGLVEVLRSDADPRIRRAAARALGEIEHGSAVEGLTAALSDDDIDVRRAAVWALGEIEDARAVEALLAALRDTDVEIRRQAARALGEIESRQAVEPLLEALSDSDAKVREIAAWALGEIEDARAAPGLAAALTDAEMAVRRRAVRALGELDLSSAPAELIAAIGDEDLEMRRLAIRAVGEIEDPAAVPALAEIVRTADVETRALAIHALAEIEDPSAYEVLVEALNDEDPDIRRAAARALGGGR